MIAAGQHIDAGGEKIVRHIARDPESAGGILAIGDNEIDGEALAQAGQLGSEHVAPGRPITSPMKRIRMPYL